MKAGKTVGECTQKQQSARNVQLWLSVLEDADSVEWPPTVETQNWRVFLRSSHSLQGCNHSGLYRTSPVFPATNDFRPPALSRGTYHLCFYCFDPAFQVLGRLTQNAPKALKSGLLYSTGLASILLFTKDPGHFSQVEVIAGVKARCKELWRIERGRIASITCENSGHTSLRLNSTKIVPYETLPLVARTTVDEFVANIAVLVPKVQVHLPSEVSTFVQLVNLANELVSEMVYVCTPQGPPPETLSEYTERQFQTDVHLQHRILHQDTDRLVQINAALSYVSTQALSGAVPILDRRSLIRRYSLLGVGTATLALMRIAHSIESAFAQGALEDLLADRGGDAAPLPGLKTLPDYDSTKWEESSFDNWTGKVEPRRSYPKLPYFSGRLGFREAEYTVSAALQALAAGAGPEWSLLTLTHEMLHGHVRNLLSILFQGTPDRRPDQKWKEFYDRFAAHCKGNSVKKESFLDSVRAIILFYCCRTITHGSITRSVKVDSSQLRDESVEFPFSLLAPEPLWLTYESESRNISEIFVHILDLHYFYCSSHSNYIPLIWRSWANVPQVSGDLRQYLLRSLLVLATKTDGSPYERFEAARARLVELLSSLQTNQSSRSPVIDEALKKLRSESYTEEHLYYSFDASLILVDLVQNVLTSSRIRGALNADPHLSVAKTTSFEEWLVYDMPNEFVDDCVVSPTAFLADRLSQEGEELDETALEARTSAVFLACASHVKGGQTRG